MPKFICACNRVISLQNGNLTSSVVNGKIYSKFIIKVYICGVDNVYRLKLYRTQNQVHPNI
jgi:hypothetical protein